MQTRGTTRHSYVAKWTMTLATLLACGNESQNTPELTCEQHEDCVLVSNGCCSCRPWSSSDVHVVRSDDNDARYPKQCQGAVCNPCMQSPTVDPLAPVVRAACVAHQCTVIDLRKDDLSKCAQDSDCRVAASGCCEACGDPAEFLSLRSDASNDILACFPALPCEAPICAKPDPAAYCAADGHCAVKQQ